MSAKAKAINPLKAIIVGAGTTLHVSLTGLGPNLVIRRCAELRDVVEDATEVERCVMFTLRLLAARTVAFRREADGQPVVANGSANGCGQNGLPLANTERHQTQHALT